MVVGAEIKVKHFSADVATNFPTECTLEFGLADEEDRAENIAAVQALFAILKEGDVIRVTFQDSLIIEPKEDLYENK